MNDRIYRVSIKTDGGVQSRDFAASEFEGSPIAKNLESKYAGQYTVDAYDEIADGSSYDDDVMYTVLAEKDGQVASREFSGKDLSEGKLTRLAELNPTATFKTYSKRTYDNALMIGAEQEEAELRGRLDSHKEQYGQFMDEYEAKQKADKKASFNEVYVPGEDAEFVALNADEYALRKKEWEQLKSDYYNNPIVKQALHASRMEAESVASEIGKAIDSLQSDKADITPMDLEFESAFPARKAYGEDYVKLRAAKNLAEDAVEMYAAPSRYDDTNGFVNYLRGARDTFTDEDFWTMGLTEIVNNTEAREALQSLQDKFGHIDLSKISEEEVDAMLTKEDRMLVDAFMQKAKANYERSQDLSLGYQSGQTSAESLGFMAQFLLTGSVTSGASKAVSKGAVKALARNLSKGAPKGAMRAVKQTAGKFGIGTLESMIDAAVRTGMTTTAARSISEYALPAYKADMLPEASEAILKGAVDGYIENWSEAYGGVLGEVLGAPFRMTGKAYKSVFGKPMFGDWGKAFANSTAMQAMRRGGFNGYFTEIAEEWFGNAVRAITIDPDALKNFATYENQMITLLSFLPMTLGGGSVSAGEYLYAGRDVQNKAVGLRALMAKEGFTEEEIKAFTNYTESMSPQVLGERMGGIIERMSSESSGARGAKAIRGSNASKMMIAATEYAKAVARYQTLGGMRAGQQRNEIEGVKEEILSRTGIPFWQTRTSNPTPDGTTYDFDEVRVITRPDGSRVFVVGQEGDTLITIDENGRRGFESESLLVNEMEHVPAGSSMSDRVMSLDQFLNEDLVARRRETERTRMTEERRMQKDDLMRSFPKGSRVNLGTEENPLMGFVHQYYPDYVLVEVAGANGNEFRPYSFEDFASYAGKPMSVLTDEQIAESEASEYEANQATIDAQNAQTEEEVDMADTLMTDAEQMQEEVGPEADYTNEEGVVNQDAFWTNDPAGWAEWNDKVRNDGGAHSSAWIAKSLATAEAQLVEAVNALESSVSLNEQSALEQAVNEKTARVELLRGLMQKYIPQEQAVEDVQPTDSEPAQNDAVGMALADLYDGRLTEEEIEANIEANKKAAQKEIDKHMKSAPKMGADIDAYLKAKEEHEAVLAALQEKAALWEKVEETRNALKATETSDAELAWEQEVDMEPHTPEELAARELGLADGIKLQMDSYMKHTGFSRSEAGRMLGIFRTKAKGGMTMEQAGERLMEIDREYGYNVLDQNDPNAGLNAILSVLQSERTVGELRSYIARAREEDIQDMRDAAYSEMAYAYEQAHGISISEAAHRDEVMSMEMMRDYITEQDFVEINNIFAEDIYNYEQGRNAAEASGVPGAEAVNDAEVGPGGQTEGVYSEGDKILPGEQSVDTRREGVSEGQADADGIKGDNKDAHASVPAGKSSTELDRRLRARQKSWGPVVQNANVVFVESRQELEGLYSGAALKEIEKSRTRGWYDSGKTYIYLPHILSESDLDETIIHEVLSHYGLRQLLGSQEYDKLCEKVWNDVMSKADQKLFMSYPGVNGSPLAAADEYIAHLAQEMSYEKVASRTRSAWDKVMNLVRELLSKIGVNIKDSFDLESLIRASYNNIVNARPSAAPISETTDIIEAAKEVVLNQETAKWLETTTSTESLKDVQQPDGSFRLSTVTYHDWTDNLGHAHKGTRTQVLERMIAMNFSDAEINDMMRRMDAMYEYMNKLRALTNEDGSVRFDEFNAWAEKTPLYKQVGRDFVKAITSLVSNGDYPINMELTTDCIKREAFTMLLNTLIKMGADLSNMGPGEIVTIQKLMRQYGIEVACDLCFVEGKRLQIVNWASQIVEDWNNALIEAGVETDEYFEFGKDGDAFIPAEEWKIHENKSEVRKAQRQLDEIELLFKGIDPAQFKKQRAKNKRALEKYKKEKSEAWAKRTKKPASQWKPSDEAKAEMKKIANEGLAPAYVNENMEEYRNAFNAMRNEWLDKHPGADPLSFTPTKKQWEALGKIRNRQIDTVRAKMVRLIMEYPEMRKKMTLNDLLGSKGLMEIRQQHGQAYADLYSIILQRFGTATPKPVQDAAPYDGELMTLSESAFKKANEIGGARLFSFSDFDITKVFDYMQMFFDLEANRQMLQSYTKEAAAVIIFGRSNAKFNISTLASAQVPQEVLDEYAKAKPARQKEMRHQWEENAGLLMDEAGNITGINFSEEHSVSPAFAQQIFHDEARNKDCGAIMVGISVNHAIYSASHDWIRMVIPFHLSGMPKAAQDKTAVKWYFDNTPFQSTRKMTKDGWSKISSSEDTFKFYDDMNQPGWNMRDKTKQYLAWCKEHGYRPKFDWGINSDYYRAYCEEQGYEPNQQIIDIMDADTTDGVWNQYYKFLTDFTAYKPVFNEQGEMIDEIPSPQLPVQSNFDFSEMEKEVLFEGEKSMLGHREENIKKAERHMDALAAQVVPFLNGEITEEEMDLQDDVFYKSSTDAENYLETLAENNTRLSAVITPEMDAEYLAAVERGDMETAQRMVIEAAKLAMPNTKVVDENGNPKVVYHGTNKDFTVFEKSTGRRFVMGEPYEVTSEGFFFAPTEKESEKYGKRTVPAYVNIENPLDLTTTDAATLYESITGYKFYPEMGGIDTLWDMMDEEGIAEKIRRAGYDGVIFAESLNNEGEVNETSFAAISPSQIKSAEPVTYDDNGNVIPLSERFNPENSDIRFSVRTNEQREQLFDAAKARFGLTNNFKVAGYMLPDGSLLDFSEANDGGDPNQRTLDHREIEGIIMDEGIEYDSRWMYLADFMNEGAIRLLPEYAGINLMHAPTKEQRQRLMDFIYKYNGEVILEIADERLNNVAYVEYDRRTSPSRIFRDIDGYFNEGIVPQQDVRFSIANENQAIFVSNAARAVEGIKMEKATPAQWLAMIEKAGGLKAGEDKWMGLSDWLKASDRKTLTKQEVLDFINEHMIQIEETHYDAYAGERASDAHSNIVGVLQNRFNDYVAEYHEEHGYDDEYDDPASKYAIEKLREEMEDTFPYTIELVYGNEVYVTFDYEEEDEMVKWAEKTGVNYIPGENPINSTRLNYTTDGLTNKHEIALTVPTIESWNEEDEIHFGDAGEGRAVAWIRFGETEIPTPEYAELLKEIERLKLTAQELYEEFGGRSSELTEVEERLEELKYEARTYENTGSKVLVIDEIQSKRHQEGREKGYTTKEDVAQRKAAIARAKKATNDLYDYIGELVAKYPGTEYSLERVRENRGRFTEDENNKLTLLIMEHNYAELELEKHRGEGVPDAPFEKNWHELAMKRMLRYAAENGYDYIAWTKGEQQAERYDIGGVVSEISVKHAGPSGYEVESFNGSGYSILYGVYPDVSAIAEVYGKELAERITESVSSYGDKAIIDGNNLKVGGEGMRGFYDKMLPAFMNKYGKKWGIKVADITLPFVEEAGQVMHSVPVTEEMKASVMEGQVMFSAVQITPEVREEMDVIKATALVDGKLGLAPNGKKSKLTEDQWALVRTRRFKEYFGDWENDPENASKVVDPETGEPMVVYHGTPNEFTVFGEDTSSKQAHTYEDTFYFMDNEEVAASYGELMPCFVNLRNPLIVDFEGGSWRGEKTEIAVQYDRTGATLQGGFKSIEEAEAWREQFLADNPAYAADADYVRAKESAIVAMGTSSDEYTQQAKEEGYDGCIFRNISDAASLEHVETLVTDVVAFAPEQVKSAVENTGEYSPENKDIRYSIRQEGQSAEDFFNQALESYKAKYKPTAPIELVEPTREFLEGLWGSEFVDEEFKNSKRTHGIYDRDSDKIYIFAKDDIITTLMIDDVLFHESIHALLTNNKKFLDLGAWLWENTGSEKSKRSRLKRDILKDYSEEYYHEEMLATMLGECMAIGKVQELASLLPEYERGLLETILNEIGYDTESETRSRLRLSGRELEAQSLFYANARSREAEEGGAESAGGEAGLRYSVRTKPAPEKTQPVYKLMRLGEDGKLYPLFIGSAEAIELGTWYDADSPNLGDLTKLPSGIHLVSNDTGEAMTFEQFKAEHPEIEIKGKRPNVAAVNWATANGMRWIEIEDKATAQRRYEGESRSYYNLGINGSGQVGQFAMRPGWHAGSLPSMRQIGKGKDKNLRDDSFVWVRGRVPADVDYQAEADANPDKDIPTHIPTDGFYMKATNANKKASQADKIGWYVAGSFIADEIISDAEARRVIDEWNAGHADAKVEYDYPRESGKDFDPAEGIRLSIVSTPVDQVMEDGLRLSVQDFAKLAGDLFAAMPESFRKEAIEDTFKRGMDMQSAINQIPARLAEKQEWDEADRELAEVIREKVQDAVEGTGVVTSRPLTTSEALWMLYETINASDNIIDQARKAIARHNLGLSEETIKRMRQGEDILRFSTVANSQIESAAELYGQQQAYWMNRFTESFGDQYQSLESLYDAIEKATGKKAEPWEDARYAFNQIGSRGGQALNKVEREFMQPLDEAVKTLSQKYGWSQDMVTRYVMLKHGLERNKVMAARDARNFWKTYYREVESLMRNSQTVIAETLEKAKQKVEDIKEKMKTASKEQMPELRQDYAIALRALGIAELAARGDRKQNKAELDAKLNEIEQGTEAEFLRFRKRDYSGLISLFPEISGLQHHATYPSIQAYNAAIQQAESKLASVEQAAELEIQEAESDKQDDIANLWNKVNALTRNTVQQYYEYGMIDKNAFETITGAFKYYVPLRGFDENTAEDLFDYYTGSISGGYAPLLIPAEGRATVAQSPIAWAKAMAATAIVAGEKNRAKQSMYYFAVNRRGNDLLKVVNTWEVKNAAGEWQESYPVFNPRLSPEEQAKEIEKWQKSMQELASEGKARQKKNNLDIREAIHIEDRSVSEHIIKLKVNGEEMMLVVNGNPRAAQAVNGLLNVETDPDYQKLFGRVLRYLSEINTSYNPVFWVTNLLRDIQTTFASIAVGEDEEYNEAFRDNYGKAWSVFRNLKKYKAGEIGDSELEVLLSEAVENGAMTGYSHIRSVEEWDKELGKYMNTKDRNVLRSIFEGLQAFSESVEFVNRFAVYITSRQMGRDVIRSVSDAKEVTVNFNRKGSGKRITIEEARKLTKKNGDKLSDFQAGLLATISWMSPYARRLIIFFNAAVQGLNMWIRMARRGKGAKLAKGAGVLFVLGALQGVFHALLDDDDYFENLSEYDRKNNFIIGYGGVYVKCPLPHEFRAIYGLGDMVYHYVSGRYPHRLKTVVGDMAEQLGGMLPINPFAGWEEFVPAMLTPAVEAGLPFDAMGVEGTNENFAGRPIRQEKPWLTDAEREATPDYAFATDYTWGWLVNTAEALNDVLGGTYAEKNDFVDIDPARIQHYIEGFTGGTGREIGNIMSMFSEIISGEETQISHIPFLNKLLTITEQGSQNKLSNEQFRFFLDKANNSKARYNRYVKDGKDDMAEKEQASKEYQMYEIYKDNYKKTLDDYNNQLKTAGSADEERMIKQLRDEERKRFLKEISNL